MVSRWFYATFKLIKPILDGPYIVSRKSRSGRNYVGTMLEMMFMSICFIS